VAEYVSADIALGKATTLNMGLRNQRVEFDLKNTNLLSSTTSKDSDNNTLTAWDISLSHNHNYGARNYVRLAKSFRFPVLDETWSYFTGNITLLKPQTGRHIEIGTRHRLGNGLLYSVDLFRIKLSDEIGYDSASFTNVNFDDTVHRGGNFKLRVPVDKRLDLQASAAYRKSYFSSGPNDGKTVPLVPRKSLTLSAQFHLPANNNIGVDAVHTGSRYFSDDLSNAGKRMPAYTRLDLNYDHRFSNITLKAAIKNVTNTNQADFGLYNPFAANPYFYYPLPERAIYFTVEGEL
jgi:iron complex outermembrane receptor protein